MVGALSGVTLDAPPFSLVSGERATLRGVNAVGLRRRGFSREVRQEIKRAYHLLFHSKLRLEEALEKAKEGFARPRSSACSRFVEAPLARRESGSLPGAPTLGPPRRHPAGSPRSSRASARRARLARGRASALRELADPALARARGRARVGPSRGLRAHARLAARGGRRATWCWPARCRRPSSGSAATRCRPDARALAALATLGDRKDDSLLGMVVQVIEAEGLARAQPARARARPCAPAGALGRKSSRPPSRSATSPSAGPWPRRSARSTWGRAWWCRARAVLALEAVEGTDAAIERGCALADARRGVVVVKVAKPKQDPRFDVPTIGLATRAHAREGRRRRARRRGGRHARARARGAGGGGRRAGHRACSAWTQAAREARA